MEEIPEANREKNKSHHLEGESIEVTSAHV